MKTIGRHVIAEFYDCDRVLLDDCPGIRGAMLDAARFIKATIVGESFHKFAPQGVSGTVVIAESHLSVHTWPENGYVAVDIYTCGNLQPRDGVEWLGRRLGAGSYRVQEILRGLPEEVEMARRTLTPEDVAILDTTLPVEQVTPLKTASAR